MSSARIGALGVAVVAAVSAAHAAPGQGSAGLSFTPVSPTRVLDPRTTGHRIAADYTTGYALKPDGAVYRWGRSPDNLPAVFPGLSGVSVLGVGGLPAGVNS